MTEERRPATPRAPRARQVLGALAVVVVLAFLFIQVLPFGPERTPEQNAANVAWPDDRTRDLSARACLDCHSGQTDWPWYASVAPMSWIVADHVSEGRALLDFSLAGGGSEEAHEAGETVREGEMPPWYYTILHPAARLTEEEKAFLALGLDQMFGEGEGEGEGEEADEDED